MVCQFYYRKTTEYPEAKPRFHPSYTRQHTTNLGLFNQAMSNIGGAPFVTDTNASLSKERVAELNTQYKARIAAEKADKEAVKKTKKDNKDRKTSSTGVGS
jgi:hypothetical protein